MADQSELSALQELMDGLDPESRTLFAEAALGRDAKDFVTSDLGRFMIGCAKQEYAEQLQALRKTPAWRWRKVRDHLNRMENAERFCFWLRELLQRGIMAEAALQQRDEV